MSFLIDGAPGRTWTGTARTPRDFKSLVSTNSTTRARNSLLRWRHHLQYRFRHTYKIWSDTRGSNSWPQPWQGCALPTELVSHNGGASRSRTEVHGFAIRCIATLPTRQYLERETRFELATPTLARLCSTSWAIPANTSRFDWCCSLVTAPQNVEQDFTVKRYTVNRKSGVFSSSAGFLA